MTSATATETNNTAEQPKPAETTPADDATVATATDKAGDNNTAEESKDAPTDAPASPSKKVEPKPTVHKTDYEEDTVYLYQFTRCPTIPSVSPFCLKVETWLRMTGLKYEVRTVPFEKARTRLSSWHVLLSVSNDNERKIEGYNE